MSVDGRTINIFSAPVSGSAFPCQLAFISELYLANLKRKGGRFGSTDDYKPHLGCASSGGNVALYVGMAADWTYEGIKRVAKELESAVFVRSWWPDEMKIFPTWLLGVFNGAVYRAGYGPDPLFKAMFTKKSIQQTEIWTGTYNATNKCAEIFCNRALEKTLVWPSTFDGMAYRCPALTAHNFMAGDLEKIGKVTIASASIPILVGGQTIDDMKYADGGTVYASPLSILQDEFFRIVMAENDMSATNPSGEALDAYDGLDRSEPRKMHFYYFNSFNADSMDPASSSHGALGDSPITQIINSGIIQDRAEAIELLTRIAGGKKSFLRYKKIEDMSVTKLASVVEALDSTHYVLYFYPIGEYCVKMTDFTGTDVLECIEQTRADYGIMVWYYHPDSEVLDTVAAGLDTV
jgi:hypothetical protein